jgi:hypothetical protein
MAYPGSLRGPRSAATTRVDTAAKAAGKDCSNSCAPKTCSSGCDRCLQSATPPRDQHPGRPGGIDVGIASFVTTSDGTHIDNPRRGRAAADKLAAAQQRLQRAKRRSKDRQRRRETVAARHPKIANPRKDFQHKQARALVERYDLPVVEDLRIANMGRGPHRCATQTIRGSICPMERPPNVGCAKHK